MRCGIYVRVSTDDQRDNGYSIDSQLRMIKEYCEKNEYDIVDVYNDAGHSGKDLLRPDMQRLLKDIKSHKLEKLIAIKVDRLTRNNYDGFWLLNYCEEHDVKIELILEPYDVSTANLYKGEEEGAFCQAMPMAGNLPQEVRDKYWKILHSDGVGTKGNVAYLVLREIQNGNIKDPKLVTLYQDFYYYVAQNAIVMNTDDMLCCGVGLRDEEFLVANTIDRNSFRVPNEDVEKLIQGYPKFFDLMGQYGIKLVNSGVETADLNTIVSTFVMGAVVESTIEKANFINANAIQPGVKLVGLASDGQAIYEDRPNSGIRSNGLTGAIGELLSPHYQKYLEILNLANADIKYYAAKNIHIVRHKTNYFNGKYLVDEKLPNSTMTVAEDLLSPTRSYLPIMKAAVALGVNPTAMFHCSGSGMTKPIKFGKNMSYIMEDLFEVPALFQEIQNVSGETNKGMYQTYNMGTGMIVAVQTDEEVKTLINVSKKFGVNAKQLGYTQNSKGPNEVIITSKGNILVYKR